jgi:uncharacterized protein (TIGR03437 family)
MRFVLILLSATVAIAGEFTTSLGDVNPYTISAITTDSAGNTYVVGSRALAGIPTTIAVIRDFSTLLNPYAIPAAFDVFVSKLDPNGKLLFTDTFAGKGIDTGKAIALDPTGNIYIAGTTTSTDFPLSKALQTQPNPTGTGFIIKLSNDGSSILYSTYFGGTLGATSISSLATDANGNLYLTGTTTSSDFPHTTGMPSGPSPVGTGNSGIILASISAAGDKVIYAGVLVGGPIPVSSGSFISSGGLGVAVDASGNAYFAGNVGNTGATNLPTTPGVLAPSGSFTGVLAKIGAAGLGYLTYLPTLVSALAVDSVGDAYIAGFKTQGINGPYLLSVAKVNPSASAVVWTNNLGGAAAGIQAIAVDANQNVWATGTAASSAFPNTNGWTTGPEFLVGLNAAGTTLTYSALFPSGTVEQAVAVDSSGLIHVAGANGFVSAIAPAAPPSMKIFDFQNAAGGSVTARIAPAEVIAIFGPGIGPTTPVTATPAGGFYPKTLAGVQVTINGTNMPLLYVSSNQINAVVPMGVAVNAATVRVINGTAVSPDYPVWMVPFAPQAFAPVINQDGTVNSQSNPASGASTVTFYATGWQSNFSPLADGQVATSAQDVCHGTCQVSTGGSTVPYGGAAPGIVAGVSQINVHIGALPTPSSPIQLQLVVSGSSTVIQSVWIK